MIKKYAIKTEEQACQYHSKSTKTHLKVKNYPCQKDTNYFVRSEFYQSDVIDNFTIGTIGTTGSLKTTNKYQLPLVTFCWR